MKAVTINGHVFEQVRAALKIAERLGGGPEATIAEFRSILDADHALFRAGIGLGEGLAPEDCVLEDDGAQVVLSNGVKLNGTVRLYGKDELELMTLDMGGGEVNLRIDEKTEERLRRAA